jgi:hypothetical protein
MSYGCSKEFGNPSGHAHSSAMLPIILILDLFHGIDEIKEFENNS